MTVASEVSAAVARSVMVRRAASGRIGEHEPGHPLLGRRQRRQQTTDLDDQPAGSGLAETFAVFATHETYFQRRRVNHASD